MSGADLVAVADKRLALDLEAGDNQQHQCCADASLMPPPPSRGTSGIANPAPLGLLCFGMTTGASRCPRLAAIRAGGAFETPKQ